MKLKPMLAVAITLVIVLGACGDSSDSGGSNPLLVAALAEEIAAPDDDGTTA